MKNPGFPEKLAAGGRLGRRALLILLLLALPFRPGLAADSPTSPYDSLRLFSEALFEITQKYVNAKPDNEIIYGSIRGMMNSLDPNSAFLTPEEYQNYSHGRNKATAEAGVDSTMKDNLLSLTAVIDGGPGATAGLEPGDHVLKINGETLRNQTTQEAASQFQGAPGDNLKLEVARNGAIKPLKITVILQPLGDNTVSSKIIDDSYGYVRLRYFNDATPKELAIALQSLQKNGHPLKGLVLDLRNNARGSLEQAVRTAALLLGNKDVVTAKGRTQGSQETFQGKERELVWKAPVPMPTVVLVDQGTARAAEIVASALRDQYQATLLGAKTLGLCGLTKVIPLQDGSALMMTTAECYTPGGQKIQGVGLEPQIQAQISKSKENQKEAALRKLPPEQDPWVQQAVELLKGGNRPQAAPKA
ncbi:MAG: S41 family peptidase [Desulfobaccales bacterium]